MEYIQNSTQYLMEELSTSEMSSEDIFTSTEATLQDYIRGSKLLNESEVPTSYRPHLVLYDILIPVFGAVIILLNLAVVISSGLLIKKGQQPRATYLFLGNIALSDLVTGIVVIFGQVFPKSYRNHYVCAFQLGLIVSTTLASIYSVGLIAIDRYLFIVHGLKYQKWVYPIRVRIFIGSAWFIGCVIGFLPLFGWYGDTDNGRVCWFITMAPKELILLTIIVGMIPIFVVIILYSMILHKALKKIIQLQEADNAKATKAVETNDNNLRIFRGKNTNDSGDRALKNSTPSKWKAIKVVMFTTASFIITWSPYFIASLMYGYCYDKHSQRCSTLQILIASPLAILGFCNSLLNPIIYAWWHKGFRTFVKKRFNEAVARWRKKGTDFANTNSSSVSKTTTSTGTKSSKNSGNSGSYSTVAAIAISNNSSVNINKLEDVSDLNDGEVVLQKYTTF